MRISVNLSDEMVKRLDEEAERLGIPRSSMIAGWIGEHLSQKDMVNDMLKSIMNPETLNEMVKAYAEKTFGREKDGEQTALDV